MSVGCGKWTEQQRLSAIRPARTSGALSDFVAANVGKDGNDENVSEYIRDLIRRDTERVEREAFERLKAALVEAFSAPDSSYSALTAADVIARHRS
jgi:antitoxin ParD1/3/4